ncbi:hypothetical protein ACM39_18290 [Chryseobacterium sp. FH2]|uniref:hypothetical protein n=1 Tax=Chryseobacterium sp. FH2 TaxID=1674291 RepID=UPI00065AFE87|nr:hypothetical protein [Chryseobacterium sp. FH2]KMQ59910.1 hypothetical protein ACM39_18290 [Chryseobacterium sp. FH2]
MKKLSLIILITASVMSFAQEKQKEYEVKPYIAYLSEYKPYYEMVYSQIETNPNISLSEKLRLLNEEISKLKNKFKQVRKQEFESKSVELSVKNWCTSKSSGGVKNCGYKYIGAPSSAFYTEKNWLRVIGTNKGIDLKPDGSAVGLKMTVAGKGYNEGTLFATFKYRSDYTALAVEEDTDKFFNLVIK